MSSVLECEKFSIVVLISGNGSNLQAIIDAIDHKMWPITIKAVLSNKADAYGLERAKQAQIPCIVLAHQNYPSREAFDQAMIEAIDHYQPQLVVLAGFMRILGNTFVDHYAGRLINLHPSLLPKHKGLHTHQSALDAGDTVHGCTVHYVSNELDSGAIIAQMECAIEPTDTAESLANKVHALEHQLLPEIIFWLADGQVQLKKIPH